MVSKSVSVTGSVSVTQSCTTKSCTTKSVSVSVTSTCGQEVLPAKLFTWDSHNISDFWLAEWTLASLKLVISLLPKIG